ncbi:unnamed protein product, partial [Didymodactylos carnosus]
TRGKYETAVGQLRSADEMVDFYSELIMAHPRVILIMDPFRKADKSSILSLCDRISTRCYITTTTNQTNLVQENLSDEVKINNCHFVSIENGLTLTDAIAIINTVKECSTKLTRLQQIRQELITDGLLNPLQGHEFVSIQQSQPSPINTPDSLKVGGGNGASQPPKSKEKKKR